MAPEDLQVARAPGGPPAVPAGPPAVHLPATLREAVPIELRRALRPPYETPVVVAVNGALMSSCWFFLPASLRDMIFTLHGSLAYALVLAAWMYSDVPATNVLGPDAERVRAALGDPGAFRRLLVAKNVVLWMLITPLCALIAVLIGLFGHSWLSTVLTIVWIGVVPFGALGLSNLVGIRFPYHPMPVRYRWEHRRPFGRMIVRWLTLAVTPYVLVPALAFVLMAPSLVLWGLLTPHGLSKQLAVSDLGWGVGVACAVALACWWGGHRLGSALARRRAAALEAFLSDPTRA